MMFNPFLLQIIFIDPRLLFAACLHYHHRSTAVSSMSKFFYLLAIKSFNWTCYYLHYRYYSSPSYYTTEAPVYYTTTYTPAPKSDLLRHRTVDTTAASYYSVRRTSSYYTTEAPKQYNAASAPTYRRLLGRFQKS